MIFRSILTLCFLISSIASAQIRTETELTSWKFHQGASDLAAKKDFNDKKWQTVTVPHDWAIYGPFDKEIDKQVVAITQNGEQAASEKTGRTGALPYIGEGWYRTSFTLPKYKAGQKVLVVFEGAMSEPKVFLNGQKVGEWNFGYNYFYFDITSNIDAGKANLLAVQLNNKGLSSRWYPGAGLYRKVRIIVKNAESVDQWGISVTTPYISPELAKVNIKTKISGEKLHLKTLILNARATP